MHIEIVKMWEKNKHVLEEYFRTTPQSEYDDYDKILKLICKKILITEYGRDYFKTENIVKYDSDDYQGVQAYFLPLNNGYLSDISEIFVTHNYYGSCSGCDTIQAIHNYDEEKLPTPDQVKEYMLIALHLIQRMNPLVETVND